MGRSLVSFTNVPLRFSQVPRSFPPPNHSTQCQVPRHNANSFSGYQKARVLTAKPTRTFCTKAVLSEIPYQKVGAKSTGPIPPSQLIQVVESAAKTGAEVVMDAVNKPRNITYKGLTDLVTDTDKASEAAVLEVVQKNFANHLILGEEGGVIGDSSSDYLWCIDPLDGTTNFAHGYPSFAVSVAVLFQGNPAAASVVEFVGGPMCWNTRTFSATAGGGAFCNGQKIHASQIDKVEQSLLVTGFGYDHDDAWATNIELFKEFTDISLGVRRLGAAAVDMCHVALGIVEAFTSWVGLGNSIKQLYEQPLHYLTNIHLKQWDQLRFGTEDEHKPLDSLVHPCKAEATVWLIEEVHRLTSCHHHLAKLWLSDPMHYVFIDSITLNSPKSPDSTKSSSPQVL